MVIASMVGLVVSLLALVVRLVVSLFVLVVSLLPFFASFRILSLNLFMYFSLPLHAASTCFGSFVTCSDLLSSFILRYKRKKSWNKCTTSLKRSADKRTSVFNVCCYCHNKWIPTLSEPYLAHLKLIISIQQLKPTRMFISYI